jgi:hypothetical protein
MAERFKAAVLKTVVDESLPRVRIPIPPQRVYIYITPIVRNTYMESWLSGRKRFTANEVRAQALQGFESLTLRNYIQKSTDQKSVLFDIYYVYNQVLSR